MTDPAPFFDLKKEMSSRDDLLEKIKLDLAEKKKAAGEEPEKDINAGKLPIQEDPDKIAGSVVVPPKAPEKEPNEPKEGQEDLTEEQFRKQYEKYSDFFGGALYVSTKGDGDCIEFRDYQDGTVLFKRYKKGKGLRDLIPDKTVDFIDADLFSTLMKGYEPKKETEKQFKEVADMEAWNNAQKVEWGGGIGRNPSIGDARAQEMKQAENQEKPEVQEDEKLKELMDQVDKSRGAYSGKDYEVNNIFAKIKKIIGNNLKTKTENISDTHELYEKYQGTLNNLLEYQIESLKNSGKSPEEIKKEMGDLISFFNWDERLNLIGARDNARAESLKTKWTGKIWEKGTEIIKAYRKLDWKYKLAISVVLFAGGAGAALAATAGISGAAGLGAFITSGKLGQKIVGGAAAGVGAVTLQEGMRRKIDSRKAEKEKEGMLGDFEKMDVNERYEALSGRLKSEIDTYKAGFEREKRKARNRKMVGASVAVFLGSGAASYLTKLGIDKLDVESYISKSKDFMGGLYEKYVPSKETFSKQFGITSSESANGHAGDPDKFVGMEPAPKVSVTPKSSVLETLPVVPQPEAVVASDVPKVAPETSPVGAPIQELPKNILTVERGSSFQGAIIKHLTEKGVEKSNAEGMAHRMYLDYLKHHVDPLGKDFSIVQPGAKFEIGIDPEGHYHVDNFEDGPKSQWTQKFDGKINLEHNPEISEIPATGELTEHHHIINPTPDESNLAKADAIEKESASQGLGESGVGMAASAASTGAVLEVKRRKNNVVSLAEKKAEKAEKEKRKVEKKLDKEKMKIEKKYKFEKDDEFEHRALKCIKAISLSQENWRFMSKFKFSDLKQELSPKLLKNVNSFEKDTITLLGEPMRHLEGETVQRWLARVVKESLEKDKIIDAPFRMGEGLGNDKISEVPFKMAA